MSGEGPDSIPTSADARSRRPLKKRALTPVTSQAKDLDALFAKPTVSIQTDRPAPRNSNSLLPPEIVANVQGSSAGAGSGEFHVYKASRRREYERLRRMDEEVARETATADFETKKEERDRKDDEKTRRNREKRDKKRKARERAAKNGGGGGDENGNGVVGSGDMKGNNNKTSNKPLLPPLRRGDKEDEDEDAAQDSVDQPMEEVKGIVIDDD
ncbi:DUF1168-domain-containing protein [Xylariaceae sp. FL0255]|nr:DUF1168-domain-containing protein [Xylariaceae sp. FL0255]